jgi:hypothetical protein
MHDGKRDAEKGSVSMKRLAVVLGLLSLSPTVWADPLWVGSWVQRDPGQGFRLTMTVEEVGNGMKFTYKLFGPNLPAAGNILIIQTQLDGKDVPVLVDGKPTGQMMGIRRIDGRHSSTVLKFQGKETGTSKAEISSDGEVLKVESDNVVDSANGPAGKITQYWDKK